MNRVLEQAFDTVENLGVCVKQLDGTILHQNKVCLDICGNCMGDICQVACMELYANDKLQQWDDWGSRVYKNSFAHDDFYDITLLCSDSHKITFLQPLAEKYRKALRHYRDINLTKREMQVLSYIIRGASNLDICEHLSVSKATIKTHLNNIYKKVSDAGIALKYLPKNRLV